LAFVKALELAGFVPIVLIVPADQSVFGQYYHLAGAREVYSWGDFEGSLDFLGDAKAVIERLQSVQALMKFEFGGARVGKIAASTALRELRLGSLDMRSSQVRQHLANRLVESMAYAAGAQSLLGSVSPDCALFYDMVYTGKAELFDSCLLHRIDTIRWHPAYKSNTSSPNCMDNGARTTFVEPAPYPFDTLEGGKVPLETRAGEQVLAGKRLKRKGSVNRVTFL